jgi:hypothetical protein
MEVNDQGKIDDAVAAGSARRIVVSDAVLAAPNEVRGRRLENPPPEKDSAPTQTGIRRKLQLIRRSYLVAAALGVGMLVIVGVTLLVSKRFNANQAEQQVAKVSNTRPVSAVVVDQSDELRRIEDDAKQVIRRISRDNRPYSFNESVLRQIQSRVAELSRSPQLLESLQHLQAKGEVIGARAAKEGLQPSLVMLLGLALTNGGESGDCVNTAVNSLPLLASLNKTFGSNEGESSLILIAAFREGPGTRRSHPLLKRMNRVVTNPLTERNVWYLNERNILSADAYALVIDTISFGVITRSPRQFGFEIDALNF